MKSFKQKVWSSENHWLFEIKVSEQMEIIAASLISLVDIRPLKMCHIIYNPSIVIEYTHGKCTGRTLREDWVQERGLAYISFGFTLSFASIFFFLRLISYWWFHPIQTKALENEINSSIKETVFFSFRDIRCFNQKKDIVKSVIAINNFQMTKIA